jgi:lactoylglutathione lyase
MRLNYAIVFVSDMKRSVLFYRDVIGLPLRFESPGWTEFATDGATLALHSTGVSTSGHVEEAGTCRPGFSVPDLTSFHAKMMNQRVECLQEPTDVFGARVAQYRDPDGLTISVGEERRAR